MELSGQSNGKPLILECGGKSPQLVFGDVEDLDSVAAAVVTSAFWNQGQVCSAHTRVLVDRKIKGELLRRLIGLAKELKPDDPLKQATNFGPLASAAQRDRVKKYVDEGLARGAVAVLQGTFQMSEGCFVGPTIFDAVTDSMPLAREEIFGPVLCVQTFESENEAIKMANASDYGLAATVWTRDSALARRCARWIRAGAIYLLTSGKEAPNAGSMLSYEAQKASGFGAEIGVKGLQTYSTLKCVEFSGA